MAMTPHPLAHIRMELGWSQSELGKRSGVPRSSISAIEARRLVPSVTTAMQLARALGCTVEDLFARTICIADEAPKWAWDSLAAGGRYWQAEVEGQVWLYPAECSRTWPLAHDGVWIEGQDPPLSDERAGRTLMVASCDPAAYLLASLYARQSEFRMIVLPRSGAAALELLRKGLVHVAALHRATRTRPDANAQLAREVLGSGFRLIRAAHWVEGLAVPTTERSQSARRLAARARAWALREPGAAARECLEEICEGTPTAGRVVSGHRGVADAVRAGWADAGVCVQLCAQEAGLRFLPVRTEALDLCLWERNAGDRRVKALVRVLQSQEYRRALDPLPGYQTDEAGEVVFRA